MFYVEFGRGGEYMIVGGVVVEKWVEKKLEVG